MRVDMDRSHNAADGAGGGPGVAVLWLCRSDEDQVDISHDRRTLNGERSSSPAARATYGPQAVLC